MLLFIVLNAPCCAQVAAERPGCTATLDTAKFDKSKPSRKYSVTVSWMPYQGGINVRPQYAGDLGDAKDWRPAGSGWIALDYVANLYYLVTYGPGTGYTLFVSVPELGFDLCSWN